MNGIGQVGWLMVALSGALVAGGLAVAALGLLRRPVRLADALDHLDGRHGAHGFSSSGSVSSAGLTSSDGAFSDGDRLGTWVLGHVPISISQRTRRELRLHNRTVADFAAEKVILAALGFFGPLVFTLVAAALGLGVGWTPMWVSLVGAVIGWFVPDLRVRGQGPQTSSDIGEAICTFVDLVTLERLANQSSTQALHRAASVSQAPVFRELQTALERARLEQRPAWQALVQVGRDLDLPQLVDLGDVIRLDEQGAALGGVLRSRAEELRDAQLMADKVHAQEVSESLTIWMAIPAMIFGLIFLVPPLMRLVGT